MMQLGDDAGKVGLIHADLHLDNALFWHGDVPVIDFDDCSRYLIRGRVRILSLARAR
jgi:Ser/Thr protein kinase RdoA (MazF antagonist)